MKKSTIYITKILISIILTLVVLILIKASSNFKTLFYKKIYNTNISFTYFDKLYNKYIGNINIFNLDEHVFNETLTYINKEDYNGGVKLTLENNLVSVNESGIVVYMGNKDNLEDVIIIQRIDGVDEWYIGIKNTNVKLYDYIKKGEIIGEVDKYLYLIYKKDGKILDYEKYIK